ncbi:MAG: zinc ribbon domain-containing protein [Actinomycetota bacterium]|nr:zinc ribbon domain-containing protein [Actinomycetota bacterium]
MPIYGYRCKKCKDTFEILQRVNDPSPTTCKSCGGNIERVFYPVRIIFKGSGFHKTDYCNKPKGATAESQPACPSTCSEPCAEET